MQFHLMFRCAAQQVVASLIVFDLMANERIFRTSLFFF